MTILVACPIKDRAWAIPYWLSGILSQNRDDMHLAALYSDSDDRTEALLKENDIEVLYDDEPGRPTYMIDNHQWNMDSYAYMARLRNRLVEYALELGVDYFFSLDSDIVLPPNALNQLLAWAGGQWSGAIAPALVMTPEGEHFAVTAWNNMSWSAHRPDYPVRHYEPVTGRADLIFAAMLLDRSAMACRWSAHSTGEDTGFCLDAKCRGVPLWWVKEIQCRHLMHRA